MAATVLRSKQAVEMSLFVVRAFVALERKVSRHDREIISLVEVVRQLALAQPQPRRGIGFTADLGR